MFWQLGTTPVCDHWSTVCHTLASTGTDVERPTLVGVGGDNRVAEWGPPEEKAPILLVLPGLSVFLVCKDSPLLLPKQILPLPRASRATRVPDAGSRSWQGTRCAYRGSPDPYPILTVSGRPDSAGNALFGR